MPAAVCVNSEHFVANNIGPDRFAFRVCAFVSESKPQSESNLYSEYREHLWAKIEAYERLGL